MSKQPPAMIVGQKGVQYGLQKVVPKKPGLQGAPGAQRKVAPANVFGDDDSEEEDVERQIARQADKKRAAAKVQQMYEEALAADPSVFDYDGVYDSIQEARVAPKQQDKVQRQSKYIASLLEQAQQRKREQDVLYERKMVKERQQEDHLFEDKERFVTSAYRRKLEEDKKWQEAERQKELEEERNDVRKVGHLGNFYANLLTKNVAFGTAKDDGEQPKKNQEEQDAKEGAGTAAGDAPEAGGGGSDREPSPGGQDGKASAGPTSAAATSGPSAKVLAQLDRYDMLRLEAERALRARKEQQQQQQQQSLPSNQQRAQEPGRQPVDSEAAHEDSGAGPGPRQDSRSGGAEAAEEPAAGRRRVQPGEGPAGGGGAQEEPAGALGTSAGAEAAADRGPTAGAGAGGKRRNDESAVLSARERYLARKQQKTTG